MVDTPDAHGRCVCEIDYTDLGHEEVLGLFKTLRKSCPALRILVPDDLWPGFEAWDRKGDHDAFHRSICVLALERGYLGRLTRPIHHYLLEEGHPRKDLAAQYAQDLQERWMLSDDPLERHRRSRIFMGRIVELQCAEWLESRGWAITGLEALREGPDIEATKEHEPFAFETKSIGSQDEAFLAVLESLRGKPAGQWTSPDAAINYVLFRAYESAKQLQLYETGRVAILVIDQMCWHDFRNQLADRWIDWAAPQFLGDDPDWGRFVESQRARYPHLFSEMRSVLSDLDAIWIVQRLEGFAYRHEITVALRHRQVMH